MPYAHERTKNFDDKTVGTRNVNAAGTVYTKQKISDQNFVGGQSAGHLKNRDP